jgi:very-short-patch-repair endonuclease
MRNEIIPYNKELKDLARKLRKQSTLSEVLLWKCIKNKSTGAEFHRQVPVDNYIVDFYCHELKLVIEIDGNSHEERQNEDEERQKRLESFGITFIRFSDLSVKKDIGNVLFSIENLV